MTIEKSALKPYPEARKNKFFHLTQINNFHVLLIIALGTIAITIHLYWSAQFQINDLSPFPHGKGLISDCLLPYQKVGLGITNPSPELGLCYEGVLSLVLGARLAQHLFIQILMIASGINMAVLSQRLNFSKVTVLLSAAIYELSPMVLNQISQGGPGIVAAVAVIPILVSGLVPVSGSRKVAGLAFAGAAALALATYVNIQAPAFVVVPLAVAAIVTFFSGNRRQVFVYFATFTPSFLLCSFPALLELRSVAVQSLGSYGSSIVTNAALSVSSNTIADFVAPFGMVGMVGILVTVGIIVVYTALQPGRYGSDPSIRWSILVGSLISVGCLVGWEVLRLVGIAWLPTVADGFVKDFIKTEVIFEFGFLLVLISSLEVAQRMFNPRRYFFATASGILIVVVVALSSTNGAILEGRAGLTSVDMVSSQYRLVYKHLNKLVRSSSQNIKPRILWLPQDIGVVRSLQEEIPSSLVYKNGYAPQTKLAINSAFNAVSNRSESNIAAKLAYLGVEYVAVNLNYRAPPNAPFERGAPTVAAIGGTKVLAGSPTQILSVIQQASDMTYLGISHGAAILKDNLTVPILNHYSAIVVAGTNPNSSSFAYGGNLKLKWPIFSGGRATTVMGDTVNVVGKRVPSWRFASSRIATHPGQAYEVQGSLASINSIASSVKIEWRGNVDPKQRVNFIDQIHNSSSFRSIPINQKVVAPRGATYGVIYLLAGWKNGRGPQPTTTLTISKFMPVTQISPLYTIKQNSIDLAMLNKSNPSILWELSPGNNGNSKQLSRFPLYSASTGSITSMGLGNYPVLVGTPRTFQENGTWSFDWQGPFGIASFTQLMNGSTLELQNTQLTSGYNNARVSWLEIDGYSNPQVTAKSTVIKIGNRNSYTIGCRIPGCTISDIVVTPSSISSVPHITRYAESYSKLLKGENGVQPVKVSGDWATLYNAVLKRNPSVLGNSIVRFHLAEIFYITCVIVAAGLIAFRLILGGWINKNP